MIERVDVALEKRFAGDSWGGSDVETSFAWPGDLVRAGLQRPTVDFFMWDANVSHVATAAGRGRRLNADGSLSHRLANPRLDVRYLTTIWCERERDEHLVLGQFLSAVLRAPTLDVLVRGQDGVRPAQLRLERPESRRLDPVWNAMEDRVHPAVDLVVAVELDVHEWEEAAAQPSSIEVSVGRGATTAEATAAAPEPAQGRTVRRGGVLEYRPGKGRS